MVYLLKNQLNPIPQAEILETLDFSANHLKSLVNNLLDLSSLQQRKIKLEERAFMLSWLLKNCINAFHFHASDKNIELRHEFLNIDDVKVIGDPDRLYQIINNLLSNAIKFTEQGSVDLIVALSALNNNRYSISVVVKDTGPGIEKKYLSRIFEPFVRVHTDTKDGSGCGLAIVKELVDLFDGTIKVESEVQRGTKFKVDLELRSASGNESHSFLQSDLAVAEASLEGVSILYVEDLEFNQKLLSTYAKLWKFDLHIVDNALEAIKVLYKKKFDIILMDIFLPSLQGDEATRMIRKAEKQGEIDAKNIILAVTALEDISNPEWLGKNGFNDIIPKPIDPSLLYQKLKWWSRKQSPDLGTYAEQNSAQTKLFHNLKSTFNAEPKHLKSLLKSFNDDLDTQIENLNLAIQTDDQSSYSKTRHNLLAMLAMLNETELRQYLINNKSIPKTIAEKEEAQHIFKDHITQIQTLIALEIEK
jgi:CheY-like chemotaxis protein/anti-sigma regulatory factor (Ser/Thr protein kinase)